MPSRFLHGLVANSLDSRLRERDRSRLPADTWQAGLVPAGARLEFVSRARGVQLRFAAAERLAPVAAELPVGVSVWREGSLDALVPFDPAIGGVHVPLSVGASYVLYLPACAIPATVAIEPVEGWLEPAADRPRWLAYGDSITQGFSASDPGRTYPALVARELELDVCNLGFAGSARGEIPIAEMIAETPADIVSLAFGTNNWAKIPHGTDHLAGVVGDFVTIIRNSQPITPVVVISPIVRPDAETTPNNLGATLADLRDSIERTVRELASSDGALFLVSGADLVDAADLVDGIHPGDRGHACMARGVTSVFERVLARSVP